MSADNVESYSGYINPHQLRRSSDGYDEGIIRVHVYEPDHEDGDPTYDVPAQVVVTDQRVFTEDQVKALVAELGNCTSNVLWNSILKKYSIYL